MTNKTYENNKSKRRRKLLIAMLIAVAFMAMEFPGILFVKGMIEPFIFGMPFLYGYMFLCWLYVCCVMFYAYRTAWGQRPFLKFKGGKD